MVLLEHARHVYDRRAGRLAAGSEDAWRAGFRSGADWMRLALSELRGEPVRGLPPSPHRLGFVKYGTALCAACAGLTLASPFGAPAGLAAGILAFYWAEAHMVFLFPLALDGSQRPFADSLDWTARAGGAFAVMAVVLPLAAAMLLGGFFGRGFRRSWCLGCLAVCVWYEELRTAGSDAPVPA